jgi:hypothetical protein
MNIMKHRWVTRKKKRDLVKNGITEGFSDEGHFSQEFEGCRGVCEVKT